MTLLFSILVGFITKSLDGPHRTISAFAALALVAHAFASDMPLQHSIALTVVAIIMATRNVVEES